MNNTAIITTQNIINDLRNAAQMSKEQCGVAVAAASDAVGCPYTAEECLEEVAKAYSCVRWLAATVDRLLTEKEPAGTEGE